MNKGLSLLGLAFRSGNLVSGEFAAREAVRKKTAALIIVANDASDNTKKMFENVCQSVADYKNCVKGNNINNLV